MTTLSILATVFGTISGFANLSQAIKIFKRKSAKDISIITYSLVFLGTVTWLLYGIELKDFPLMFSNGIALIFISLIIIGWFMYGRKK